MSAYSFDNFVVDAATRRVTRAGELVPVDLPAGAAAQVIKEPADPLDALAYVDESLNAQPVLEPVDDAQSELEPGVRNGWYDFRGKYTTGGERRLKECPRYTQAGNAVPPFLGELVGMLIRDLRRDIALKAVKAGEACQPTSIPTR